MLRKLRREVTRRRFGSLKKTGMPYVLIVVQQSNELRMVRSKVGWWPSVRDL